ncbi:hypothetical protein ACSSS7_007236 [Eimeria intestinalis]
MITDQQSKIGALQQELAGLLNEVSAGKQAFQECTTSTAAPAGPEAAGAAGASSVLEGLEPPVMDVEEAVTQVMEEQAAMNGAAAAKTMEPQEMIVESPEQQIEVCMDMRCVYTLLKTQHSPSVSSQDAISKIDQLEAEKTHYKYDMHSVQNSFSQ